jgi:RimJ/RimL family protein N-acetyltransferase
MVPVLMPHPSSARSRIEGNPDILASISGESPDSAGASMRERHVTLRDGETVLIRPLAVDDAGLYPDFLAEVTAEDLRLRFFAPMRQVSPELIDKLIHYDPHIAMAFIAIAEATGRMLGVVRLHDDRSGDSAEFAILLRTRLKGHGLGWLMMKHMIANARDKGLTTVQGQVLAENVTMLRMCEELGFHVTDDPIERGVKVVTLPLAEVPAEAMP